MTSYRIRVTLGGREEDVALRLLDALEDLHPEVGAVTSEDLVDGTFTSTFSLDAENWHRAGELSFDVFAKAAAAANMTPAQHPIIEVSISPEHDDEDRAEPNRELVYA